MIPSAAAPDPHGLRQELAAMVRLAVPVVTVQLGLMAMGVVDTMMVGRVSATALAAAALGNVYFFAVAIFGIGVLMALDPVVAQAVGARDEPAMARGIQRGLLLAAGLALLASLLLVPVEPVLRLARQPADVVPTASAYARVSIAGMVPFYAFVVLRQSLQAMRRMRPIVVTVVAANLANAGLNYLLIFGKLGLPAMGVVGAAWATAGSRWLMAGVLLAGSWRALRAYLVPFKSESFAVRPLTRMLALGAPIGLQHQLEYGVFGLVGLMMGWFGTVEMAGHQVALNIASFTFMVPLGVSAAAAVLVGHAIGKADVPEARRAAVAALLCGVGFMAASAVVMVSAPGLLARAYTGDPAVRAMAAVLIPLAGLFQVFDGTQVVSIGVLRGAGDTRAPMVVNLLGFWVLGVPVSWLLGFRTALGPRGLWWGLVFGLAVVGLILVARVRARLSGTVARVVIDGEPAVS